MRTPTIKDVAKRAGVGVGTVSRVLNGSPQVRPETREKVMVAIRELGFSPNLAARQLSGGKTFTIGVVSPFFTFPSFVERLAGIQDVLDDSPYDLVLYSVRGPDRLHHQLRSILSQKRVDGLIVLSLRLDEDEVRRMAPDMPVVVVDNNDIVHYPHVMIDNFAGGLMATRYLIGRGHTAIGFIGDPVDNPFGFQSTIWRFEGFKAALEEANLPLHEGWIRFGKYDEDSAHENAQQILTQPTRPTALFVAIDTLALGAMAAIYDLGLRVPDDVAIIGFDDIQAASYIGLTTVRQQLTESGRWSAQRMLDWLREGELDAEAKAYKLPLEIVVRSTA
ncbi:MAG: LacI family transcriptional regulator [Anaerolineae bacterium]|nr:LacI family transcriptional regulator [Anaerolineae bacterium]